MGVTPQTRSLLITDGWTIENFSCVVSDETALDAIWDELVPDGALPLLQKAALRAAYKRCRSKMDPSGPLVGSEAAASTDIPQSSSSWTESLHPSSIRPRSIRLRRNLYLVIIQNWLIMKQCQVQDFYLWYTTNCSANCGTGCPGNIVLQWQNLMSCPTSVRPRCLS